jgi:alkylation response protein AidB-like acyl-CoA dehydrogenase
MWDTGLMTFMNPAAAGGHEPGFAEMLDIWQRMAWLDGSFGWIGIANLPSSAAVAAYLPDEGFEEVFGSGERVTMGGQFAPNGQGVKVEGGYRLTGSWNFGSGTGHSPFVCAGFLPIDDGNFCFDDDGQISLMAAVLPRDEITFTDGWHVQGLKGTGSYDYEVADVFVPEHRTMNLRVMNYPLTPIGFISSSFKLRFDQCGHIAAGFAKPGFDHRQKDTQ